MSLEFSNSQCNKHGEPRQDPHTEPLRPIVRFWESTLGIVFLEHADGSCSIINVYHEMGSPLHVTKELPEWEIFPDIREITVAEALESLSIHPNFEFFAEMCGYSVEETSGKPKTITLHLNQ